MPTDNSAQWNPVQEFHQNWPNSGLSDSQIVTNLQDPSKFRSAFPHYTGVSDKDIQSKMKAYMPTGAPGQAPASGPPVSQPSSRPGTQESLWGQIAGTMYPQALSAAQSVLNAPNKYIIDPVSKTLDQWKNEQSLPTVGQSPAYSAAKTFATGVGADVTKTAVGMFADPKNWPFMLSGAGEVAPVLKAGTNALFVAMQGSGAIDAVKNGDYQNAAINAGFSMLGLAHLPTEVRASLLDKVKAQAETPVAPPTPLKTPEVAFAQNASAPKAPDTPGPLAANKIGEGTSAVHLAEQPRVVEPSVEVQNQTSEILRLQNVLHSPNALPEEKAYAVQAIQASEDLRDQLQNQAKAKVAPEPPKVAADIVPSNPPTKGLTDLTPAQQDVATEAVSRISGKAASMASPAEAPLKKMVEDAGGLWRGSDSMGLAHYDAPPEMVGGRQGVSIASNITKMNPDFVLSEFARKANEFSATPNPQAPTPLQQKQEVPSTLDLLPQLRSTFNQITKYTADVKNSTNTVDREQARFSRSQQMNVAAKTIRDLTTQLPQDQLPILRDYANKIADQNTKQAEFIKNAVDTHNRTAQSRSDMVAMRATGYTEQAAGEGNVGEGMSVERQAETAPLSRSILDQLQGRKPRVTLDDLKIRSTPEGMNDEQWNTFAQKLKGNIRATHDGILRDAQILLDTGDSIGDSDIPGRLRELDRDVRMLGKFPAAPASPGARPSLGGVSLAPAEPITLARAQQMLGRKVNKIPEMNEFSQKADELNELASLHRAVGKAIDAKIGLKAVPRATERGAVGEMTPTIVDAKAVSTPEMVSRAKALGLETQKVSDKSPAGSYGWLSPDGDALIKLPSGKESTHSAIAEALLPALKSETKDVAATAMQEHGWIRKVSNNEYEAHLLDSRQTNTVETDMIRNGSYGQKSIFDTNDAEGKPITLRLDPGWGEKYDNLSSALDAERRRMGLTSQIGKVRGPEITGGMATGMAIGYHVGGVPGAVVGGVLGASTPAVLRSTAVANAFRYTRGIRTVMHIDPRTWFSAPPDNPAITPDLQTLRDKQLQAQKAPERQLSYRMNTLAGDVWKKLDPFAFVTDRPNPVQDWTMKEDPRGKGFRDAKGQLNLDESPYVAVRTAVTGIRGGVGVARQMYGAIERDAQQAGLHGETQDYLNLKAYQRAYQVIDEHMQAMSNETTQLKQQLSTEDDVVKQVGLYNKIEQNTKSLKEMGDIYRSGKVAPLGYDPPKIQNDLNALQQNLGQQKMQQVQAFAKRVFDLNRQSLDLIADVKNNFKNGIITQEEYNTYTSRGDEYIPMRRIMENMADTNRQFYGKTSPLYLRQQNVIKQLEGSELVNVDPFQASADANAEAIREHYRNRTLSTFIDAAHQSPDIAQYFQKVRADYTAARGEKVVGLFRDGQQQRYKVPQWLGESLDTSSLFQAQSTMNIVNRAMTGLFKASVTTFSPAWVLARQIPNVAFRELVTAEGPMDPHKIASAFRDGLVSSWTHDDKYMEAQKEGLQRNSLQGMLYPEAKVNSMQLGWKGPLGQVLKHPIQTIAQLSSLPTEAIQLGHWNRLRQAGYSPKAATYKTIHYGPLPDYAQMGKQDGIVAQATTFLRADWAHIRSDLALATADQYKGKLALTMMAIAVPAMALAVHNIQQKDANGQSLWNKVADIDKERYWVHLTGQTDKEGNPTSIKIGKPDYVQLFGNPMEDMMYKMLGQTMKTNADTRPITQLIANTASRFILGHPNFDANAFQGLRGTTAEVVGKTAGSTWQNVAPALRVPAEEAINQQEQFGRMNPIVTNPKLSPEFQGYGAKNVSPTAMDIGHTLGMSPQRVEHVIRGTTGTLGRTAESLTDPLLANRYPPTQGQSKPTSPMTGVAIDQSMINAQNKFYSTVQQVSQPYANFQMLKKQNPTAAMQYMQQNGDAIWKGQLATTLQSRLGEINQRQKEVDGIPLNPNDREALNKNLRDVKMQLLDSFQGLLDRPLKATVSPGTGNATSQGTTK